MVFTRIERLVLRLMVALVLLTFGWFCYEGMSGPRRNLTKREKRMVAELGPKMASDARFSRVAFQGEHSDHSNVLLITGTVASVEVETALYELIETNRAQYGVRPSIRVKVQDSKF